MHHTTSHTTAVQSPSYYILQVNGVKLADILFSLLCVCVCALSPVFNSVCPSHNASATWRIYALSEHLLVIKNNLHIPSVCFALVFC